MADTIFHCLENRVFENENQIVRAFVYENYSIEPHNHEFYEMNIILGGTGTHNINNRGFTVKTGDVFVIPPKTVHSYSDTENLDVYHLLMHHCFIESNRAEANEVKGFIQFIEIEPFLRKNYPDAMFLHLLPNNLNRLKEELRFIADGNGFDGEEFYSMKNHAVWKILYWLSYLLDKQMNSNPDTVKNKHGREIIRCLD